MANWKNDLRADRRQLIDRIQEAGKANVARKAGTNDMVVSRFCNYHGSDSAEVMYRLAKAVGMAFIMVPEDADVQVPGELFPRNRKKQ